jgi:hypothetical protein
MIDSWRCFIWGDRSFTGSKTPDKFGITAQLLLKLLTTYNVTNNFYMSNRFFHRMATFCPAWHELAKTTMAPVVLFLGLMGDK